MSAKTRPKVLLVRRSFVRREEDGQLLLIRRSPDDVSNAGLWEAPGGKVEIGQDLVEALEIEVRQETGYLIQVTHPLCTVESRMIPSGKYRGHLYLALFSVSRIVGGTFALSHEHSEHAWVTYKQMLSGKRELTQEVWKAAITMEKYLQ